MQNTDANSQLYDEVSQLSQTEKVLRILMLLIEIVVALVVLDPRRIIENVFQSINDPISFIRSCSFVIIYGLSFSMLLFIFVSGFFLIFGLADVINFAHGALFMLGGFIGFEIYLMFETFLLPLPFLASNHWWLSLLCFIGTIVGTGLVMAVLGAGMEMTTIRRLYGNPIGQILLTTGFLFIILKLSEIIWGPAINVYTFQLGSQIEYFFLPESEFISFGNNFSYSLYRILIIIIGLILAIIMFSVLAKTKIGLIIQAAIEDPEMVQALGINTKRMFLLVFVAGTALAGIAGVIAVPDLGATLTNGSNFLLYAFIIVVIGGAHHGRLSGTFYASLIIGLSNFFTLYFFTGAESVIIFLIMVFVLIFKPGGLTGEA